MTRSPTRLALRILCLAYVYIAIAAGAAAQEKPPAFMHEVFPPELVMRSAREIGLKPEQRRAITEAIQETQAKTVELEWEMQEAAADLEREMSKVRIDEKVALAAAERVMSIEGQVKRAHLGLLIQIKNQLDAGQQEKLRAIRDQVSRRERDPGWTPGSFPTHGARGSGNRLAAEPVRLRRG